MQQATFAKSRLDEVCRRIEAAAHTANRDPNEILLIGASKKQPLDLIRAFVEQGLSALGENYLQEALDKQLSLNDLDIAWHFIGSIQSNKTNVIANQFDWVHGVDRAKIATRLAQQRQTSAPLNVIIQLNLDAEESKAGVTADQAPALIESILSLEKLRCRGFMLIPAPRPTEREQRAVFAQARALLEQNNERFGITMDTLSMGMSNDLEAAIVEGSTMVRIGTDLFGPRET